MSECDTGYGYASRRIQNVFADPSSLLSPGRVSSEYFSRLIAVSSIRSEKVIRALHDFYVSGKSRKYVCTEHQVGEGYLSLKIKEMRKLNENVHAVVKHIITRAV